MRMQVAKRRIHHGVGALTGLALLAACHHSPATPTWSGLTSKGAAVTGAKAKQPSSPAQAVTPAVRLAKGPAPIRVSVRSGPEPVVVAAGGAEPMTLSAASGGLYTSPDGSLTASIPPGALSQDAAVSFERLAVPAAESPSYIPGVRYRADLGGARVLPGHAIQVRVRLTDETLASLGAGTSDFDPAAYQLTTDGQGRLAMTLRLAGPSLGADVPAPTDTPAVRLTMIEFGGQPIPGSLQAPPASAKRLLAAPTTPVHYASRPPSSLADFFKLEREGIQLCDFAGTCMLSALIAQTDMTKPVDFSACGVTFDLDPTQSKAVPGTVSLPPTKGVATLPAPARPGTGQSVRLPVHVTWRSDDPALHGKPAMGAVVRFRLPGGAAFGPDEVVVGATGAASTFAPDGTRALPSAYMTAFGGVPHPGVPVVATAGMAPVPLEVENNNPVIMIQLNSPAQPLPASVKVSFRMGDCQCLQEVTVPVPTAGSHTAVLPFSVKLGNDKPAEFRLTGVDFAGAEVFTDLPPAIQIQRNGIYPVAVGVGENPDLVH